MSRPEFLRRVEDGEFLEWAEFGRNLYGTPAGFVDAALASGNDVIVEIELKGARQVRARRPRRCPSHQPPSLAELERRFA